MNPLNANLTYDRAGLNLTESSEGDKLVPYKDPRGIWTEGTGHTGADVIPGHAITQEQSDQLLEHDIQFAENFVKQHVTVALTQGEFDGCTDLCFNIGVGNFLRSSVLRLLNAGDKPGAAKAFELWDKISGRVSSGLLRRRLAEETLFLHGVIA